MTVSSRKRLGVVYTPASVVELILDNVLPMDSDALASAVICDPACGDGAFLTAVASRILAGLDRVKALAALRRMTGYDIDRGAVSRCRVQLDAILNRWYPSERVDWNVSVRNVLQRTLFNDDYGQFTHVVGNPPYVRVQHLEQSGRQRIAGQWNVLRGATDLYLVFYELGLGLVREGGTVGFITPSSWLRSDSGSLLRNHLVQSHGVRKIIDCGEHQIFPEVTTYTAIAVIEKCGKTEYIPVERYDGLTVADGGSVMLDKENPSKHWWIAPTDDDKDRMLTLAEHGTPLVEIADIHVGIQTLADGVFIRPVAEADANQPQSTRRLLESSPAYGSHLPCRTNEGTIMLERWILRPIVKASVLKEGQDRVQRAIIFPYDNKGKLLRESYIANNAPAAYEWLLSHKDRLLSRDKGRFDPARWYAFGRHASITSSFGPKILTSGMNRHPNFQLCPDPDATFYSGYCVKPKPGIDPKKLLAALNSDDMDFFIRHTSRPYQGGWMSYAKSFIKDFPVPQSVLE